MFAAGPATAQSDDPVPAAGDFAQVAVAGVQADETPRLASESDATARAPGAQAAQECQTAEDGMVICVEMTSATDEETSALVRERARVSARGCVRCRRERVRPVAPHAPADFHGWEAVVEFSAKVSPNHPLLVASRLEGPTGEPIATHPGTYAVRLPARGRDTAYDLVADGTEEYLVQAWPAPGRPLRVVQLEDQVGRGLQRSSGDDA